MDLTGIVKTLWYNKWIQTSALHTSTDKRAQELNIIHKFLVTFEVPLWAGQLPSHVGEPAGGSLTADKYKLAVIYTWPIITFKKREVDTELKPPKEPHPRLHADEPVNLLHLSTALEIFYFLFEYRQLDGAKAMKPNFHWAVHLEEQIRDFGPDYNFWTFLSERLNKLLKSSNSNNWTTGGLLEISMMRKFIRGIRMDALAHMAVDQSNVSIERVIFQNILGEGEEAVGTIQDASVEEEVINDGMNPSPHTVPLHNHTVFYRYAILDGRQIIPISQSKRDSAGSSLVKVNWDGEVWYGKVVRIFHHPKPGLSDPATKRLLAKFRWMKEVPLSPVADDLWSDFPELDVMCFRLNEYWYPNKQPSPPIVLPFDQILCQITRGVVESSIPPLWITTSLDRVCGFLLDL
ncbi:hypothetical protein BD769DRAFT_1670917 [Suillus cothurnatus]|nr:hypothetical protein BD769DRAFT_1670917 [Suillus cothurnatus]